MEGDDPEWLTYLFMAAWIAPLIGWVLFSIYMVVNFG